MLLKAGTYTFNDGLTEGEFEQSIDILFSIEDDAIVTLRCSKLIIMKYDYFALIGTFYSEVVDGEEQLEEDAQIAIYSSGDGWNLPLQTHTITEDTEVNDTFGAWYKANTDYNTVNSGETTSTKKFTRLYLGDIAYSSNGKSFRRLQTEETESIVGTWVLNSTLDLNSTPLESADRNNKTQFHYWNADITFNKDGEVIVCNSFYVFGLLHPQLGVTEFGYYSEERDLHYNFYQNGAWLYDDVRTITITTDNTNEAFKTWLKANATKIA